jgi:hypothetical protein
VHFFKKDFASKVDRKIFQTKGFEVITAVKMPIVIYWIVTPCGLAGGYQRLGGICHLHLQG